MDSRIRTFSLITILLMMTFAIAFAGYSPGEHVADFTINDAYGNPVSLYDYEGMIILINFWTDT